MTIQLNGESRAIDADSSVAKLLDVLGLSPARVAVELNLELVPRARHAETVLHEGDRLEVVTLVGGG